MGIKLKNKRFKLKSFSLLVTCLFIAFVILLNVMTGMLTERFFLRADLTATGLYTLSERAEEFVRGIREPVDIVVLEEESAWLANSMYTLVVRILENYSSESGGRIRVQYVNPDLNAFDGPQYGNNLTTLKESYTELEDMQRGDIVLVSSRRAAKFAATDLFTVAYNSSTGRYVTSGINADYELVSSLQYVLNETIARVVFTSNHQENASAYIKNVFERSGYVCQDVNLATEDIPEDTLLVVSAGPKADFLSNEVEKLEQYLALGGSAMILYDFNTVSLPLLDALLEQWGVIVESKMIFDEDYTYIPQLGVIGAHAVTGAMAFTADAEASTKDELRMGIWLPRPLRSAWVGEASGGFYLYPLIQTFSASSYAKELSEGGTVTWERESGDESGPFILAYNTRKLTVNREGAQVYSNLIVAGANSFSDDFMMAYGSSFYNALLIADIAAEFNPFSEGIYIPPKQLSDSAMPVSSGGARGVLVMMVIMLPLLIIASGVVVWRKRRNL